jgi:hypothetical protein
MTITKTVFLPFSLPCPKCNYFNLVEHTYTWRPFEILCMLYSSLNFRYLAVNKNPKKIYQINCTFCWQIFTNFPCYKLSWDSSVSVVTRLWCGWSGFNSWEGQGFFSLAQCPDSYRIHTRGAFPRDTAVEAWSSLINAKVWSSISIWDNFTITIKVLLIYDWFRLNIIHF